MFLPSKLIIFGAKVRKIDELMLGNEESIEKEPFKGCGRK